jgi:ribose 5-phosphate isomerase A
VPFARRWCERALRNSARAACATRDGATFRTDNGNEILDCRFADGIADARRSIVRSTPSRRGRDGLFIGLAHVLVIGHPDGRAEVRER